MPGFWPFDFSLSGIFVIVLITLFYYLYLLKKAAEKAIGVAKTVMQNNVAREVGLKVFAKWLESFLGRG